LSHDNPFDFSAARAVRLAVKFERFTVDALHFGRIRFMCRDPDSFESAEIFFLAMMFTLTNTAFDAGICTFLFHVFILHIMTAQSLNLLLLRQYFLFNEY